MIFNPHLIALHHEFAKNHIGDSDFLIEHAACELIDALALLNTTPHNILELGPRAGHLSRKLTIQYPNATLHSTLNTESNNLHTHFDLIVSCMNFHWTNEVEKHLKYINSTLTDKGKYVLNFASAGSLENLKHYLLQCELDACIGHSPHIIPFPREDRIHTMFQQCGFKFVVVSTEKIELEYANPVRLMKDLQNMGENNALTGSGKALSRNVLQLGSGIFSDIINLVTVVAAKNLAN
jgi:NADH dehydrogenase [ubiquinone] 1 alpha subcomplex assembly factor 5